MSAISGVYYDSRVRRDLDKNSFESQFGSLLCRSPLNKKNLESRHGSPIIKNAILKDECCCSLLRLGEVKTKKS
jgi:hypothetical protein